jgi:hypothetical protein
MHELNMLDFVLATESEMNMHAKFQYLNVQGYL